MSKNKIILSVIFLLAISFIFAGNTSYASATENDNTICKGVFIDEVDVSGMTRAEAQKAVNNFVDGLRSKGVAIMVGDNPVYTTLGDLGYTYEPNDSIEQAFSLGQSGNLIKRYKDLKDIEQGRVVYPLTFTMDDAKLKDLITVEAAAYNIPPVNATVTRKNDKFVYTDHINGSKVEVDKTAELVVNIVFNNWNRKDIVVDAVMEDDKPIYTRDIVEKCNTILGTFTTEYVDSAEGRAANLANGARLINNTVIYPGDVFSGYKYLSPFTPENGYYTAHAYLQGKIIDSIGGGACQVTTTLYNAVLFSELEIVERQAHSMTISYVDLSRDAAIAGTDKNLKFKNNTDAPFLVEAYTIGKKITFTIWGHETRDTKNRRIEYVTVVLKKTNPPADVVTKDPKQLTTYRKVTQSAYTGYKAELYKVVYENDVEVSRTLVNKSSYAAVPRYITIGTKPVPKKPAIPKTEPTTDTNTNTQTNSDAQIESESTTPDNLSNPEDQVQADVFWDPSWDEQGLEDE